MILSDAGWRRCALYVTEALKSFACWLTVVCQTVCMHFCRAQGVHVVIFVPRGKKLYQEPCTREMSGPGPSLTWHDTEVETHFVLKVHLPQEDGAKAQTAFSKHVASCDGSRWSLSFAEVFWILPCLVRCGVFWIHVPSLDFVFYYEHFMMFRKMNLKHENFC